MMEKLRSLWTQMWITLVVLTVLLAIYTSLGRQLIPLVETYRDDLILKLETELQQPVAIGSMMGAWDLLSPVVLINEVKIGTSTDAIVIEQIRARLDLSSSLFFRNLVFSSIDIIDVSVNARRISDDQLQLADDWIIPLTASSETPDPDKSEALQKALTWLGLQHEIRLQGWSLGYQFTDRQQQENVVIDDLRIRSQGRQHLVDGIGYWGDKAAAEIYINAELYGDLWPWDDQRGDVYLRIGQRQWQSLIPADLPRDIQIPDAQMSAEGWLTLADGDLHRLSLTLQTDSFELLSGGEKLQLDKGQIQIEGGHLGDDWHLRITPTFATSLPVEYIEVSSVNLPDTKGWLIDLPEYRLENLLNFIMRYQGFPPNLTSYLKQVQLTGQVDNSHLMFIPGLEQALAIELQVEDFSSEAYRGIPGVRGASGLLQLQPGIGAASLSEQDIEISFPTLYEQPRQLTDVTGRYLWEIGSGMLLMRLEDMQAKLEGTEITGQLAIRIPQKDPLQEPHIALQLGFEEGPLSLQRLFMPDLIAPEVADWLNLSLIDGTLNDVCFILNGNPAKAKSSLSTLLTAEVSQGHLRYADGWPDVVDLDGEFQMNIPNIDITLSSGQTLGGRLDSGAMVTIRPWGDDTEVQVSGTLRGDSDEALAYFQDTPLVDMIDNAVADWQASGQQQTQLNIRIPIESKKTREQNNSAGSTPQVSLRTQLQNTRLVMQELDLMLDDIDGQLVFSNQRGLRSKNIRGRLFGGPITAAIDSVVQQDIMDIQISAEGQAQWSGIKQWLDIFLFEPVVGSLEYEGDLLIRNQQRGGMHLRGSSDGIGTEIKLPPPLQKLSSDVGPIQLSVSSSDLTDIRFNFRDQLAGLVRSSGSNIDRGQITLGGAAPILPSQPGIEVTGRVIEKVDVDRWWDVWDAMRLLSDAADQRARSEGSVPSINPVTRFDIELAQLDAYGTLVDNTTISGRFSDAIWNVQFANSITQGLISIPLADLPLTVNLDYIHWLNDPSPSQAQKMTREQYLTFDPLIDARPSDSSPMNINIQELYVDNFNYGRWQLTSRPTKTGLVAQITDSDLQGLTINGQLTWDFINGQHQTQLREWQLASTDIGSVQQSFRLDPFLQAEQFVIDANLAWPGSPLAVDTDYLQAISGNLSVRADTGSVDADGAEALKVFGILNANTLARRLRLDFSDLASPGFSYDTLRADAELMAGRLSLINPLKVEGTSGKFLASGMANLAENELDMKLAVTFPLTGTLPVVAFLAGMAPPVAGAIYITEKLIGDELERFSSAVYSLQGSVSEPQLTIDQAFDNDVEGRQSRGLLDRILSIFGLGKES